MNYTKFDIENWNRKEHFAYYRHSVQCGFSLTTKIDITRLISSLTEKEYKFYPAIIYILSKAVNLYSEFKLAIKDDDLIIWDKVDPAFTIFHQETETFSSLWAEYSPDFHCFLANYATNFERYKADVSFFPQPNQPANHFHISSLPWVSFDGFNLNVANFTDYFAPIFTMGKYYKDSDQIILPLAIQVHHAACDGFHVARLMNTIQKMCNERLE
ncbi:type A chloramphenicol O-acetyltransferase [Xenorhabdus doucetiae]|uniref:Chloramphenicol acetyltransferase n=1 Tax=Xenorhabdus doucetiae TaxID=351671 RepID=A0A068QV88_9GAMM|nr:type A chloramphenicol O-acetyltransferase [Xenorhabdus doucetiae]TYP02018.1 chloramphenicol O-acetyltransferase type A [Xenorhabdus doucetiae]CDG18576.1 Chloramphenicol acetyltransferase 3 [Xenorhabdus doucetiae]